MLETDDVLRLLVQSFPQVRTELLKDADDWLRDDGTLSPCMIFATASYVVADRIMHGEFDRLAELFGVVEQLLTEGTEQVREAAATYFLENLTNRESLDSRLYVPLMGNKSKAYCRALDDFAGVKTPGL